MQNNQGSPLTNLFKRVIGESVEMTDAQRLERNAKFQQIVDERTARGLEASLNGTQPKTFILASGPVPGSDLHE
jgi:hypothetical protein